MEVKVVRSNRKTMSVQVNSDLTVTVRAPVSLPGTEIERILQEKKGWIRKALKRYEEENAIYEKENIEPLTDAEIEELTDRARKYIPDRVSLLSEIVDVTYGKITIRSQKTRWGSCSSRGNLNFNCLLMLAPPEVTDYVIVHELCHRKEMNHSKKFWQEVKKIIPDYKNQELWLKTEGRRIIRRRTQQ